MTSRDVSCVRSMQMINCETHAVKAWRFVIAPWLKEASPTEMHSDPTAFATATMVIYIVYPNKKMCDLKNCCSGESVKLTGMVAL